MFESMDDDDLDAYQHQMAEIYNRGAGIIEISAWIIGAIFFVGGLALIFERASTFEAFSLAIGAVAIWVAYKKDLSRTYYKREFEAAHAEIIRRKRGRST